MKQWYDKFLTYTFTQWAPFCQVCLLNLASETLLLWSWITTLQLLWICLIQSAPLSDLSCVRLVICSKNRLFHVIVLTDTTGKHGLTCGADNYLRVVASARLRLSRVSKARETNVNSLCSTGLWFLNKHGSDCTKLYYAGVNISNFTITFVLLWP